MGVNDAYHELQDANQALLELVQLKQIKDEIDRLYLQMARTGLVEKERMRLTELEADYKRRKPQAWKVARLHLHCQGLWAQHDDNYKGD